MNKLWILILFLHGFASLHAMELGKFNAEVLHAAMHNDASLLQMLAYQRNTPALGAALVIAAQNGNAQITGCLSAKVDQSRRDLALVGATEYGHTNIVMLLLDDGVSLDAVRYARNKAIQMNHRDLLLLFHWYDIFLGAQYTRS